MFRLAFMAVAVCGAICGAVLTNWTDRSYVEHMWLGMAFGVGLMLSGSLMTAVSQTACTRLVGAMSTLAVMAHFVAWLIAASLIAVDQSGLLAVGVALLCQVSAGLVLPNMGVVSTPTTQAAAGVQRAIA